MLGAGFCVTIGKRDAFSCRTAVLLKDAPLYPESLSRGSSLSALRTPRSFHG